jgi:hypothetical protein
MSHAVHFVCWERFYYQSHRTQRNKCPYGCHEHGVFIPVKLKWCGNNGLGGGVKRKLEEYSESKSETVIKPSDNKRACRTMQMEFDHPMSITYIEQIQAGDIETKQLFMSFLQDYSSQIINYVCELASSGTAELNVKGIPAMIVPTPRNENEYEIC